MGGFGGGINENDLVFLDCNALDPNARLLVECVSPQGVRVLESIWQ